jgi:predicted nucleotidyltransferase component of viral defense system
VIPIVEIKEAARAFGVPPSTIERDYAQNWLLVHLSTLPMALKGGTGIRKVFIESYRFSDDLDFTLLKPYEKEILQEAVRGRGISRARGERHRVRGGYRHHRDGDRIPGNGPVQDHPHERIHPDQDHHRSHDRE